MSVFSKIKWNSIKCSRKELRLDISLKCGQSFRWKSQQYEDQNIFIGVIKESLLLFKQDDNNLHYSVQHGEMKEDLIKDYFNLTVDLESLYKKWSEVDPIFNEISCSYPGVRMLRQDPVENLFSFICSANNNIQRISGMVENLALHYGDKICNFGGTDFYSFPKIDNLAQPGVEAKLRELGFGYRAKYIEESAKKILELGGEDWLFSLRKLEYSKAKESLLQLSGIGPKVADCILLMSLDQPSSIPVDTHVFQIAKKYLPHLNQTKTVTNRVYLEIGEHFRGLYGPYAGWAHSVLFSADLRHLQDLKKEPGDVKVKPEKPKKSKQKQDSKNGKVKTEETSMKQEMIETEDLIKQEDIKMETVVDNDKSDGVNGDSSLKENKSKKRSKTKAEVDLGKSKKKK